MKTRPICEHCQNELWDDGQSHGDEAKEIWCEKTQVIKKLRTALEYLVRTVKDYHPEACTGTDALVAAEKLLEELR
mgnify:CR=1 FL=1